MPPSRPLRADARRNREALLAAAREAFLAGDDAGVEEIARRAGVSVGTLYRHFETREVLVAEVYRQEAAELCATPARLLTQHAPDEALRVFLLLLVEHAAVGKGMGEVLENIMTTDSPVFDEARDEMARALDELLAAGVAAAASAVTSRDASSCAPSAASAGCAPKAGRTMRCTSPRSCMTACATAQRTTARPTATHPSEAIRWPEGLRGLQNTCG